MKIVTIKSWGVVHDGDYPYLDESGRPFLCKTQKEAESWCDLGERAVPVEVTYIFKPRRR